MVITPLQPYTTIPITNTLVSSFVQRASLDKEQAILSVILNNTSFKQMAFTLPLARAPTNSASLLSYSANESK